MNSAWEEQSATYRLDELRKGPIVEGKTGIIKDVKLTYDSDHRFYRIVVKIDYISGLQQDAIIPLNNLDGKSENIEYLFELFNYPYELDSIVSEVVICIIDDGFIKGFIKDYKYFLFYKLSNEVRNDE